MTYIEEQLTSSFHMQAKKLLVWMIIITSFIPGAGYFLLFLFFLYTSFPLLKQMFMWMIIFMVLSAIFPPLAIIIWFVVIIFLIIRIKFIKDNWLAIKLGIKFYTVLTLIITALSFSSSLYGIIFWPIVLVATVVGGFFIAKKMATKFDKWLSILYSNGYSSKHALGIMGSAPLLLLTLLLPFLKVAIPADFVMVEGTDVKVGTVSEPVLPKSTAVTATPLIEAAPTTGPTITETVISETKPTALVKIQNTSDHTGDTKLNVKSHTKNVIKSGIKVKANTKGIIKTGIHITGELVDNYISSTSEQSSPHYVENFEILDESSQSKVLEVKKDVLVSQHAIDELIKDLSKNNKNG